MGETVSTSKPLIVYYSFEGNTKRMAEAIAEAVGGDLQPLVPVKERTPKGFGKYMWGGRQVVFKKKPKLEPLTHDPSSYGRLFLGSPVWAWTYAPPLRTFFATVSLTDKKVALFYCHEGGPKKMVEKFEAAVTESGGTVVGSKDFLCPLKHDPAAAADAAQQWSRSVIRKM